MHEMSAIYHSTNWTGENAIAPFMPSPDHRPSDTLSSDDGPFLFRACLDV
jgi:hypothetical protein